MKWGWVLVIFVAAWVMWLANGKISTQEQRITQLECALAQAHAEADTLETMLTRLEAE